MIPLIPVVVLSGLGVWAYKKKRPGMTPQRKAIYEAALRSLKDPIKLRGLADQFEKEGLKKEADLLRKRAALAELPKDQKIARKNAFRKGLLTADPKKAEHLANLFNQQGATGSAAKLFAHASALKQIAK